MNEDKPERKADGHPRSSICAPARNPMTPVFDRFGLFGIGTGSSQVKIYFDDLSYSAAKP
jgi:hypothetical protein